MSAKTESVPSREEVGTSTGATQTLTACSGNKLNVGEYRFKQLARQMMTKCCSEPRWTLSGNFMSLWALKPA